MNYEEIAMPCFWTTDLNETKKNYPEKFCGLCKDINGPCQHEVLAEMFSRERTPNPEPVGCTAPGCRACNSID